MATPAVLTLSIMGALSNAGIRRVRRGLLVTWVAALGALVVAAPSVLAGTERIDFYFNPDNPSAVHQWTAPDGVTEIEVEVVGAGGGGVDNPDVRGGNGALVKATVSTQDGDTFTIRLGGGGEDFVLPDGKTIGGAGGGGASIMTSSSPGLTDLLIIAGGGGGAGRGAVSSGSGGDAGANANNGNGGNAAAVSSLDGGLGGSSGRGRDYFGRDYVIGSTNSTNGAGGARTSQDRTRAAAVGGLGGQAGQRGGNGGAGYGGGGMGNTGASTARGGGAGGSTAQGRAVAEESISYSTAGGAGGVQSDGEHGWVTITWVTPPAPPEPTPEPEPDPASTASVASPEPVALSLAVPIGISCTPTAPMIRGAWVRLPSDSECSRSSTARAGDDVELLGWATTPDFPVCLAAEHALSSDSSIELHNDDGLLTAVFIPAGGWTHVTGDNTLFPIWSN